MTRYDRSFQASIKKCQRAREKIAAREEHTLVSERYQTHYQWRNHGQNVRSTVARYYEPSSTTEVQHIIQEARRNGKKVRVVGDGHSWSPLAQTEDYLISTRRFNRILQVSNDPPQITVEPGATIAATLRAYRQHHLCLPMNVDIPTLTIGGAVAVGANGFSKAWGTYADFVQEIELVTGTGEIRTINKDHQPEVWQAVACSLGTCGVFTKITLNLVPMFQVKVMNHQLEMDAALAGMSQRYADHDYTQYFWFPFNRTVTLQTADVTNDPLTWTKGKQTRKNVNGWMEAVATHLAHPLLLGFPRATSLFTRFADRSMQVSPQIMQQSDNMLLGQWINFMTPSRNASVSFPSGPDDPWMGKAWMMAVNLVNQFAAAGRYAANLAMNIRLFGKSDTLLHMVPGAEGQPSCNIQITSFNNPHWDDFQQQLMLRWLEIPGARPHWAKEYQDIPGIASILHRVYGENLQRFLQIREQEGFDPDNMFMNSFLSDLFFAKIPLQIE